MRLCMGCMNEIEDHMTVCPICGYDESTLVQESYYLDPGTVVGGKYIVGRVLEYNRFYVTYLGWDAELNRKVTIQEYLPSDFSTRAKGETEITIYSGDALEQFEEGLSTFLNEGNIIEHLPDLPGILKVYDCIAENDTGYIVNEYWEGQSLKELLEGGKVYDLDEAKEIMVSLLNGLSRIHASQVMHYDICPNNVLVSAEGEIKLINFGAAKYTTTSNSKSLAIILKPGYAPEEQYRSLGEKGPWSDVYAAAALMYRLITGVQPEEAVERAMIDNLKPPSELGVQLPKATENAIMNALNVYKEYRTPSAEQFLNELSASQVKRIAPKKGKIETGQFPLWAKGLIAGLTCVIIAGSLFIYRTWNTGDIVSRTASMIDAAAMNCTEAKEAIEQLGAKCKIVYIPDNEDPEGTVWAQSVEAGRAIDSDTLVVLTASGGTGKLTIPDDWIGQEKYDDIEQLLNNYQISCEKEEDSSDEKKGFHLTSKILIDGKEVTNEQIDEGSAVFDTGKNQSIKLCYYKPDDRNYEFELPDFAGSGASIDDIKKTKSITGEISLGDLLNTGYKPIAVFGKDMQDKKVIKQSIKGRTKVSAKDELIVYYCGKNLEYKAGDSPVQLQRTLKEIGIKCQTKKDVYSDSCPEGTIYSVIYPGEERYAKEGDTVTIHLSMGKKPVVQPQPPQQPQAPQNPPPQQQPKEPPENKDNAAPGME